MSNNRIFLLRAIFCAGLAGFLAFSAPVLAQTATDTPAPPAQEAAPVAAVPTAPAEPVAAADAPPPTVTDIVIDKTDKNAVMARDKAITEARRTAFQQLAEKSMTPEAFKTYKMPDDQTIATLVQDFEIKNEQISANRYVASFTVRFTSEILNYIKLPADTAPVVASAPPAAAVPAGPRDVLVLPYFENIAGKKLLWEDPNPWRDAWQATGNSTPAPGLTISVPQGDLADISSGSTDAVWTGDYSAIEKLRKNYNASEVALTVANKSSIYMNVDLYIYRDGKLAREKSITPYTSEQNDKNSFKQAVAQVTSAIQSPEPFEEHVEQAAPADISFKGPVPASPAETATAAPAAPTGKITLEATMSFGNFTQWLEVQRRLAAITPIPTVEICSLSKNEAQFSIAYNASIEMLKAALAGKGLALDQPVVEVNESVLGSSASTKRALYELRLLN